MCTMSGLVKYGQFVHPMHNHSIPSSPDSSIDDHIDGSISDSISSIINETDHSTASDAINTPLSGCISISDGEMDMGTSHELANISSLLTQSTDVRHAQDREGVLTGFKTANRKDIFVSEQAMARMASRMENVICGGENDSIESNVVDRTIMSGKRMRMACPYDVSDELVESGLSVSDELGKDVMSVSDELSVTNELNKINECELNEINEINECELKNRSINEMMNRSMDEIMNELKDYPLNESMSVSKSNSMSKSGSKSVDSTVNKLESNVVDKTKSESKDKKRSRSSDKIRCKLSDNQKDNTQSSIVDSTRSKSKDKKRSKLRSKSSDNKKDKIMNNTITESESSIVDSATNTANDESLRLIYRKVCVMYKRMGKEWTAVQFKWSYLCCRSSVHLEDAIAQQMERRRQNEYSILRRIIEGDDVCHRLMCLMVLRIHDGMLEMYDGYYSLLFSTDCAVQQRITAHQLNVSDRVYVFNAERLATGQDILAIRGPAFRLHGNSLIRVPPARPLGYVRNVSFVVPFNSISRTGGLVPAIDFAVTRVMDDRVLIHCQGLRKMVDMAHLEDELAAMQQLASKHNVHDEFECRRCCRLAVQDMHTSTEGMFTWWNVSEHVRVGDQYRAIGLRLMDGTTGLHFCTLNRSYVYRLTGKD